jgi:hypothetical protein
MQTIHNESLKGLLATKTKLLGTKKGSKFISFYSGPDGTY